MRDTNLPIKEMNIHLRNTTSRSIELDIRQTANGPFNTDSNLFIRKKWTEEQAKENCMAFAGVIGSMPFKPDDPLEQLRYEAAIINAERGFVWHAAEYAIGAGLDEDIINAAYRMMFE